MSILAVSSSATKEIPAKIASGEAKIAVVTLLSAGDYWEQWIGGVQSEARRLRIKLDISNADGDHTRQARYLQEPWRRSPMRS